MSVLSTTGPVVHSRPGQAGRPGSVCLLALAGLSSIVPAVDGGRLAVRQSCGIVNRYTGDDSRLTPVSSQVQLYVVDLMLTFVAAACCVAVRILW